MTYLEIHVLPISRGPSMVRTRLMRLGRTRNQVVKKVTGNLSRKFFVVLQRLHYWPWSYECSIEVLFAVPSQFGIYVFGMPLFSKSSPAACTISTATRKQDKRDPWSCQRMDILMLMACWKRDSPWTYVSHLSPDGSQKCSSSISNSSKVWRYCRKPTMSKMTLSLCIFPAKFT